MHYGVDLGNMEALWKRALHELDGSCSARSSDDEKERAFWHGYFEKKTLKDYRRYSSYQII